MSYDRDAPTGNCQKCAYTFGTLGCCDTISNIWKYNCDDGMNRYANKVRRHYDEIVSMSPYDMADWIASILTFHGALYRNLYSDNGNPWDCDPECPLFKCCNDQPTDSIEGWLERPVEENK